MEMVSKFIFLFLIGTTLLNFLIALLARVKTNFKEYNLLLLYWLSIFINFIIAAILSQNETQISFAYFFQFICMLFTAKILLRSLNKKLHVLHYSLIHLLAMLISSYLILKTNSSFTVALLPVAISTCLPLIHPAWLSLVKQRKTSNWIEKSMGIIFITGIIHHFNYIFFRLDESSLWWGWGIAIIQFQCLSIFLPLLVNHHRDTKERRNLEQTLSVVGEVNEGHHEELDNLYAKLNSKSLRLKRFNEKLEEEREINEVLMKAISHDLANPITVISAYVDILLSRSLSDEEKKALWPKMKNNTKSALNMIKRIKEAIITRNKANLLQMREVLVLPVIEKLQLLFETKLKGKEITLEINSQISSDSIVYAEENALIEHVFANILSNSIKFSHQGSKIILNIFEDEKEVHFEFIDFGVGVENSRLAKKKLGSTPDTEGENGSGFGIMICSYFLRHFDGKYKIHSEGKDLGTKVNVSLNKTLSDM